MIPKNHQCSKFKMIVIFTGLFLALSMFPQLSRCQDSNQTVGNTEEIDVRVNSLSLLNRLGTAIMLYAGDNKEKYPENLNELKAYLGNDLDWILSNVCYIQGKATDRPDKPIAFDKTILTRGNGTSVLFNDGHVEFVNPDRLAKLGIPPEINKPDKKQNSNIEKKDVNAKQIILKVVGPNGEALANAKVYQSYFIKEGQRQGKEFICDNNGIATLPEAEVFKYDWQRKGIMLYGLFEGKLAGFMEINSGSLGGMLEMKLTPSCRVYGKMKSTELDALGQKLDWTNVYVRRGHISLTSCSSKSAYFEFLLPEGKYKLDAYGTRTYDKNEDIEVPAGQKELEINIDLPADRLAHLLGKDTPEFQQIKGWINSKPLKLSDLHGKVVLLDFWGTWCGPCVQAIPELIDLYEKDRDKGLVIIGVHDNSMNSVENLKKEIKKLSKQNWNGKKVPYPLALDGGTDCNIEGTQRTAPGATTAAYGINSFPTMVLIDKQGKVIDQYYPGYNDELLEKLLTADVDKKP